MKLNCTREEWAKIKADGRWYYEREKMALEDIATLHAEVERLRGALENIVLDCEAEYSPSHGAIKYACKMALGDTHD
jgi:hypothetical protein